MTFSSSTLNIFAQLFDTAEVRGKPGTPEFEQGVEEYRLAQIELTEARNADKEKP